MMSKKQLDWTSSEFFSDMFRKKERKKKFKLVFSFIVISFFPIMFIIGCIIPLSTIGSQTAFQQFMFLRKIFKIAGH